MVATPPVPPGPPDPWAVPPDPWAGPERPAANPWSVPPPHPAPGASGHGDRTAFGIAVAALVTAVVGLVVAVVALVMVATGGFLGAMSEAFEPLQGQVPGYQAGTPLAGARIAAAVESVLVEDGWEVERIECDDAPPVEPGVTVGCSGTVDHWSGWSAEVEFTGTDASFLLHE